MQYSLLLFKGEIRDLKYFWEDLLVDIIYISGDGVYNTLYLIIYIFLLFWIPFDEILKHILY